MGSDHQILAFATEIRTSLRGEEDEDLATVVPAHHDGLRRR
jgi:hypothetical protein